MKKNASALRAALLVVIGLGITAAQADTYNLRNRVRPGGSINIGPDLRCSNLGRYDLTLRGSLDVTSPYSPQPYPQPYPQPHPQPYPQPQPFPQPQPVQFQVGPGVNVSCLDISQGGRPGAKVVSCWDTGIGRNHGFNMTPVGCTAWEGPANYGSQSCTCLCSI